MAIAMEESNLYFFFGIIPYRYDAEKRIFILSRTEKYLNLLFKCCVPNLTLIILGICQPEIVAVDASLANIIYGTQMILNVAAFCLNIFESYRNDEYYKNLHQFCSLSNRQSENSNNRVAIIKIAILAVFYGYYGVSMVLYVFSLGMFSIQELCFYNTYNYIEFASIVNILYVASLFRTVRNYLEDLRHTVVEQHPTKARRKHSNYIKQKSGLINELNLRVSFSMGNIYLAASSMFYTAIYRLDRMEYCQSWPICNETAFYFGSCLAQLLGVGSFCYEVQQCINEEQELARKLSDLRENFAKNNKESPSTTMTKISVLYRPPAISAYGLFEINLNFFYQMIAAIFTQCVILFQFQSFEQQ